MKRKLALVLMLALMITTFLPAMGNAAEPNELPFVTEPTKIVIATPTYSGVLDWDTNEQTLEIEAATGLEIEWMLLPETDYAEKINIMFSSGADMPDAFWACEQAFTSAMLATLGAQGLIVPLDDLIEEYGYNVQQQFEQSPQLQPLLTSADGSIYFLPKYSPNRAGYYQQRFWINTKFMEALGIEKMPETTEEYYEYLKAVKEGDPNGNGKADEIPLAAAGGDSSWMQQLDGFLMMPFIYTDAGNGSNVPSAKRRMYMTEDAQIEYAPVQEGWREGLRFLNRLYDEDLISTEVFTLTGDQLKTLVENETELVGSLPSGGVNAFANMNGERRKDYAALPPLEGPDGTRQSYYDPYSGLAFGYFVIPSQSENKELVMKLADYLFTQEAFIRGRYGVEGRDWQKPAEGTLAWDGTEALLEVIGNLNWGDQQNVYLMCRHAYVGIPSHSTMDTGDPYHLERVLWDAKEAYDDYENSRHVPPLTLTEDESREAAEILNTLHQYVELSLAEFVTGARSLDNDWDAYVKECEKIGYQRLMEINQAAFDRQWADTWIWEE